MRDPVPLTNAVAARMIVSAMSGFGGFDAILARPPASVPTAADAVAVAAAAQAKAAIGAAVMNAQAGLAAKSAAGARAVSPASRRSREHHSERWLPAAV